MQTYLNNLQTRLNGGTGLTGIRVYNLVFKEDDDVEEIIEKLSRSQRNTIFTHTPQKEEERYFSGGKMKIAYTSQIIIVARSADKWENVTTFIRRIIPFLGTTEKGVSVLALETLVRNALKNNKLANDYLNLGGLIVNSSDPVNVGGKLYYLTMEHFGERVECS